MSERFQYDTDREPPAATLPLLVGRPGTSPTMSLVALVDTGADSTVLPKSVARRLQLPLIGDVVVRGVGGATRRASIHSALVQVAGVSESVEILALGEEILVGRDLLNRWTVTFRGPEKILEVDARSPKPETR